jgi:hypothetical protein
MDGCESYDPDERRCLRLRLRKLNQYCCLSDYPRRKARLSRQHDAASTRAHAVSPAVLLFAVDLEANKKDKSRDMM